MKHSVTLLDLKETFITKKINFVCENEIGRDFIIGFIIYKRKLNDYGLLNSSEDKNKKIIDNLFTKQSNFPQDELDNIILNSVRNKYPNSHLENTFVFIDSHEEFISNMTKRFSEDLYISIFPDITGLDIDAIRGRKIFENRLKVKIYVQRSSQLIKDIYLNGTCKLEGHEDIFDKLNKIKFL